MSNMIYADNAATTQLDIDAFEAMKPLLIENYANPSQPYLFSKPVRKEIKKARETIAKCINADSADIYFTSGGTESDNWVLTQFASDASERIIITSSIEHHAVLKACEAERKIGRSTVYILDVDCNGLVIKHDLEKLLYEIRKEKPNAEILVSIMTANNEIGTIEPIAELCGVAHRFGALFHTDAVQAVGHINLDVNVSNIDFLSASAHKFNGPKGIGFLYVKGSKICSFHHGGAQEKGLRAGTEDSASIVAMAVALKKNCEHLEENFARLKKLEGVLLNLLSESGLRFMRNGINHLPGNISLSFENSDGEMLLHRLDLKGICVATGSACDSVNTQVSHVIKAIGVPDEYAKGTIRISLGKNNTEEEVVKIGQALISILTSATN